MVVTAVRSYAQENTERKMKDKMEAHKKANARKQGTEAELDKLVSFFLVYALIGVRFS